MNYFKIINMYLDGLLSEAEEIELFQELSSDETLRSEFRSLSAIKETLVRKSNSIVPSSDLRANVFAATGFTDDSLPVKSSIFSKKIRSAISILSNYSREIVVAISSSIITLFIALYLFNYTDNDLIVKNNNISKEKEVHAVSNSNNIPNRPKSSLGSEGMVEEQELPIKNEIKQKRENTQIQLFHQLDESKKNPLEDIKDKSYSESEIADQEESHNYTIPLVQLSNIDQRFENKQYFDQFSTHNIWQPAHIGISNEFMQTSYDNTNWFESRDVSLEMTGAMFWSLDNSNLPSNSQSLENLSFSIAWYFENSLAIGLDYRRDRFDLVDYSVVDGEQGEILYLKNNMESYNLFLKYSSKDFSFWNSYPFIKWSVGLSGNNTLNRFALGLEWFYYDRYSFVFSPEYNLINYETNGRSLVSGKIGINMGLAVAF